jgi:hypothetical protein
LRPPDHRCRGRIAVCTMRVVTVGTFGMHFHCGRRGSCPPLQHN